LAAGRKRANPEARTGGEKSRERAREERKRERERGEKRKGEKKEGSSEVFFFLASSCSEHASVTMAGDDRHKKKLLHPSVLEEEVEAEEEEEEEEEKKEEEKGNAAHSGLDAASMRSTDGRSVLRLGLRSSQLPLDSSQKSKTRAEISSNNKKIPEPLRRAVAACLSASLHQHHLHQQAFLTLQV
jgi:hypothetical protein